MTGFQGRINFFSTQKPFHNNSPEVFALRGYLYYNLSTGSGPTQDSRPVTRDFFNAA